MKQKPSIDIYNFWYFTTLVVCMINYLKIYSLWGFYDVIGPYLYLLSLGLSFVLFVFNIPRYRGREILLLFLSLLFVLLVGINSERLDFLWVSFTLIIGAKGLPFRDIVKVHFIVCLCFCLLNFYGYEIGALKQANNYFDGFREGVMGDVVQRLDFGYGYATDFANHVFYILLDLWILRKGRIGYFWIPVYIFLSAAMIIYSDSRLAAGSILLIVIISFYLKWKDYRHKMVGKKVKWSLVFALVFFVLLSIWATMAYDPSNLYWVAADLIVSYRLRYGSDAIAEFGISWFGQPVEMHGAIDAGGLAEYNFVDCTYMLYLLRFGVAFMVFLTLLFCKMAIQALKRNDVVLLFAFFLAGMTGVIAQYVFDFKFCVVLLALMASHKEREQSLYAVR